MGKPNWWVLGPFTAVMLALAVVAFTYDGGDSGPSPLEARHRCEDFADQLLKSPGSADYNLSATQASGVWTVVGTVDSQNSFGGSVRSNVRCVLHYSGSTAYLDDISVE